MRTQKIATKLPEWTDAQKAHFRNVGMQVGGNYQTFADLLEACKSIEASYKLGWGNDLRYFVIRRNAIGTHPIGWYEDQGDAVDAMDSVGRNLGYNGLDVIDINI